MWSETAMVWLVQREPCFKLKNGLFVSSDKGPFGAFSLIKAEIMGLIVLWVDKPFFISLAPIWMTDKSFWRINVHGCEVVIETRCSENLTAPFLRHRPWEIASDSKYCHSILTMINSLSKINVTPILLWSLSVRAMETPSGIFLCFDLIECSKWVSEVV